MEDEINETLLSVYQRNAAEREDIIQLALSIKLIKLILGDEWFNKFAHFRTGGNKFLKNASIEGSDDRYLYQFRLSAMGEILFTLHSAGLTNWLQQKFQNLPLQSAFAEAQLMSDYLEAGLTVEIPHSFDTPGGDFLVQVDGESVPVEVSLYEPNPLTRRKLIKKATGKSDQFPACRSGIVALYLPFGVIIEDENPNRAIESAADELFRRRPSLIALHVAWDFWMKREGAIVGTAFKFIQNPNLDMPEICLQENSRTVADLINQVAFMPFSMATPTPSPLLKHIYQLAGGPDGSALPYRANAGDIHFKI